VYGRCQYCGGDLIKESVTFRVPSEERHLPQSHKTDELFFSL
jgi:hypothetical protein